MNKKSYKGIILGILIYFVFSICYKLITGNDLAEPLAMFIKRIIQ